MTETRTPTDVADPEARWATIRPKLEADADVLAGQGTLVAKDSRGRRVWAVGSSPARAGGGSTGRSTSAATTCRS